MIYIEAIMDETLRLNGPANTLFPRIVTSNNFKLG